MNMNEQWKVGRGITKERAMRGLILLVAGCVCLLAIQNENLSQLIKRLRTSIYGAGQTSGGNLQWESQAFIHLASPEEENVVARFRFRNVGNDRISIRSVKSSCDSLTWELDHKEFNPGENGKLEVTFPFAHRAGKQLERITIETDDIESPVYTLILSVDIPTIVQVSPALVEWSANELGTPKTVNVTFDGTFPGHVTEVRLGSPALKATVQATEAAKVYQITLTASDTAGPTVIPVRITTDLPFPRLQTHFVYSRVAAPGRVVPDAYELAGLNHQRQRARRGSSLTQRPLLQPSIVSWQVGERAAAKTIHIVVDSDNPTIIDRVVPTSDLFVVKLVTSESGKGYELTVTPKETSKPAIDSLHIVTRNANGDDRAETSDELRAVAIAIIENEPQGRQQ
jgi:hypothetical protein